MKTPAIPEILSNVHNAESSVSRVTSYDTRVFRNFQARRAKVQRSKPHGAVVLSVHIASKNRRHIVVNRFFQFVNDFRIRASSSSSEDALIFAIDVYIDRSPYLTGAVDDGWFECGSWLQLRPNRY